MHLVYILNRSGNFHLDSHCISYHIRSSFRLAISIVREKVALNTVGEAKIEYNSFTWLNTLPNVICTERRGRKKVFTLQAERSLACIALPIPISIRVSTCVFVFIFSSRHCVLSQPLFHGLFLRTILLVKHKTRIRKEIASPLHMVCVCGSLCKPKSKEVLYKRFSLFVFLQRYILQFMSIVSETLTEYEYFLLLASQVSWERRKFRVTPVKRSSFDTVLLALLLKSWLESISMPSWYHFKSGAG